MTEIVLNVALNTVNLNLKTNRESIQVRKDFQHETNNSIQKNRQMLCEIKKNKTKQMIKTRTFREYFQSVRN